VIRYRKIWNIQKKIVKWYGKCGRKIGRIMKWYGKDGRKVSWNVKWYGKYGRKTSPVLFSRTFSNCDVWNTPFEISVSCFSSTWRTLFPIFSLIKLFFFCIFQTFSLFNLPSFHNFHSISLFNLLFFCIFHKCFITSCTR
jgi:hypothetical protein